MFIAYEYMTTSYIHVTAGIPTIGTSPEVVISVEDFIFITVNVIDNLLNGICFFSHFILLYDKYISILKCKKKIFNNKFHFNVFFYHDACFFAVPPSSLFPSSWQTRLSARR